MNLLPFDIKIRILEYDGRWIYLHSRKIWIQKIDKENDKRYCLLKEKYMPYSVLPYSEGLIHTTWYAILSETECEYKKWENIAYYTEYQRGANCNDIIMYEWSQKYLHIDEYGNKRWITENSKQYRISFGSYKF